ncbi:MAG: hypothetical protein ABIR57_05095 [Aeromicrobium sp.]
MRIAIGALLIAFVVGLTSCGSNSDGSSAAMPTVESKRLDVAISDLAAVGIEEDKVEIVGGGALGVISKSNWIVCTQEPGGGEIITGKIRLIVDRECPTAVPVATPEPATSASALPSPSATLEMADDSFKMPNLVGKVLQDAQDELQTHGSYVMDQQDARGLNRFQMLDSNWKVCSQRPAAGIIILVTDTVTLRSVKLNENCP